MRAYKNYSDEDIIEFTKEVTSLAQLLGLLNLKKAGGNYAHMKKILQRLNVDTSHWKGMGWNKGDRLKDWSDYSRVSKLKPHLINERGNICENCLIDSWDNSPIILEVHNIDGDRTNNKYENLKLLCPNCHSQTSNWRNRTAIPD